MKLLHNFDLSKTGLQKKLDNLKKKCYYCALDNELIKRGFKCTHSSYSYL